MLTLLVCILTVNPALSPALSPPLSDRQETDLFRTITAICLVESSGGRDTMDGDGGRAVGPLQIHRAVLTDVNRAYGTHYRPADRRDLAESVGICLRYLLMWAPAGSPETWARIWNGGPRGPRKASTRAYWRKVRRHLELVSPPCGHVADGGRDDGDMDLPIAGLHPDRQNRQDDQ